MSVRVIAGTLRSRRLQTPSGARTRPTSARVREAVFSILGDLERARVLDLFAGSGALGIEALSRGAAHATFVESDRGALVCIRGNLEELALGARSSVVPLRVGAAHALLTARAPFELVLCDPPWAALAPAVADVARLVSLYSPDARVVFEHPRAHTVEIPGLVVDDRRTWGDTGVTFFRVSGPDREAQPELDPSADGV